MTRATSTVVRFPARGDATPVDEVARLVERARAGEMAAWSALYRAHWLGVFRHLCGLTGSKAIAEDLAQETFAQAMVGLRTFSGRSAFSTWLHGVALNVVRGYWRTRSRADRARTELELAVATRELASGEVDRQHQMRTRAFVLYAVLEELPETLREAFLLRYVEGLPAPEVAERLGIEAGAVRVRAHRARQRVETRLVQLGWNAREETSA
jgi:RNA polymerase sigma-70 factor (ECF subfamily)